MFHNVSWKAIQRTDSPKKDGTCSIYIRVIANRKKKDFALGFGVKPGNWCAKRCQVIAMPTLEGKAYNDTIKKAEADIFNIVNEMHFGGVPISIESIAEIYQNPQSKVDFLPYLKKMINIEAKRFPNSEKQYWQMYHKLRKFKPDISFYDLNLQMVREWDSWMASQKLMESTRGKHHKNLNKFIGIAIENDRRIISPYNKFKIQRVSGVKDPLQPEELQKLAAIYKSKLLPDHLQNTLRYFLFACGTGMRYSDIKRLEHTNIIGNQLTYWPQKVKRYRIRVSMKLSERLLSLIDNKVGKLFNVLSDQRTNLNLHRIAKIAGIKTHLTFHVARYTFATVTLEKGEKPEVLMEKLGITKWATVKGYIKIAESRIRKVNDEFDELFADLDDWEKDE